jgi:crotonobetainyl-CoA:carnitine CoA-transferase CaiB-like acyl-CoA transferase
MTAPLPLDGLRILALTQLGAGPYAMTLLGDLGAEIIKTEDPVLGGDEARRVPPGAGDGDGVYFQSLNRNARYTPAATLGADTVPLLRGLLALANAEIARLREAGVV